MNDIKNFNFPIDSKTSEIRIREMSRDDLDHYCELFCDVFSRPPWNEQWTIKEVYKEISRTIMKIGFIGMVARTDSIIKGYITGYRLPLLQSVFYIDQLFVHPEFQGKSFGKLLLVNMLRQIETDGLKYALLLTKTNTVAEHFYLKNGFTQLLRSIRIRGKSILFRKIENIYSRENDTK